MKLNVGIIGSGNIGTDLLIKVMRSPNLNPVAFVGRRSESDGIQKAIGLGVNTSIDGINYFKNNSNLDLVFDCTDAITAGENYEVFRNRGIKVIDMTPAKIGPMCIPTINADAILTNPNINMVTCGGQASIPILHLISQLSDNIDYIEIVSQIASKSAGMATRINIDQYIHTTENAIQKFTNCKKSKVILNLNPAIPCVDMQTTMFIKTGDLSFEDLLGKLNDKIKEIKSYVSFYDMTMLPVVNEDGILIISVKVKGAGDYLPSYAGNLDIINCAAIRVAERLI